MNRPAGSFTASLPHLLRLSPRVQRLVAPNSGPMTGPGTNTYLLGEDAIAVLDPGPDFAEHVDEILALGGGRIKWVLATHTHRDHSPAAANLAERSGASLIGRPPPPGQHQDRTFIPQREPGADELLQLGNLSIRAIHTPGHASNHVCYLLEDEGLLFTGDHILNGSTTVIMPPDGDMTDYLESLERLKTWPLRRIAPGHGDVIDSPLRAIDQLIRHRLQREAKVLQKLAAGAPATLDELVLQVYDDVDPRLHGWARYSLLAHLNKLARSGRASKEHERWRKI